MSYAHVRIIGFIEPRSYVILYNLGQLTVILVESSASLLAHVATSGWQ